uniref:Phosphatidylinositol 3,4,5-trisphosphate 3-phosphatase and dual-specificity protein phosphatase PTEN n=1 Tax=Lygus hesperus TaxID=30085 RepID=A0A0A9XYQ8_LYGHE
MEHAQNVISVHCKAGKGRTGTMIACLLVYLGYGTASQCLEYFGKRRTRNAEGVTIPSQIRYVHYFDQYCRLRHQGKNGPAPRTLFLRNITIINIGKVYSSADIHFTITQPSYLSDIDWNYTVPTREISSKRHQLDRHYDRDTGQITWDMSRKLLQMNEDIRFEFSSHTSFGKEKLFQFWINTRFVPLQCNEENKLYTVLTKKELDKATKDCKHNKKYPADLRVMLTFDNVATVTLDSWNNLPQSKGRLSQSISNPFNSS